MYMTIHQLHNPSKTWINLSSDKRTPQKMSLGKQSSSLRLDSENEPLVGGYLPNERRGELKTVSTQIRLERKNHEGGVPLQIRRH
jgi:hypothetical protein